MQLSTCIDKQPQNLDYAVSVYGLCFVHWVNSSTICMCEDHEQFVPLCRLV